MKLPQFQKQLKQQNIDLVFLAHPDPNMTYFTQMVPSHGFLIITPRKVDFYLTKLDRFPQLDNIRMKEISKEWAKKLRNDKIKRIGINKSTLTVSYLEKIKKAFPKAKFVDVSLQLNELRMEKTPEEIRRLTKACKVTSDAFNALIQELPRKTLRTEQDVANFLEKYIQNRNCQLAFPTIVASGKNAAIPHHVTTNKKLKKGFLLLDFGAKYKNYHADMSRVLYLGTPNSKEKEFYHLLLNSQQEAVNAICQDASCSEIDKLARTHLKEYSSYFIHALGHGVGVEIHEHPSFKDEHRKISKNHVFTIEPGIYFPGKFGLRIEDTVLFDGKTKILTKASKELISIPF